MSANPQVLTEEKMAEMIASAITNGLEKNLGAVVEEKIQAEVKKLNLDKIDLKHKVLSEADEKSLPGLTDQQEAARKASTTTRFIKALFKGDFQAAATLKGMSEGIDSEGGFTVPEETAAELNRIVENVGLIRKLSRNIPMTRDSLNLPILGSAASVSWPGEAVAGTDGSPTISNVRLLAKTAVGLAPVTNELLQDANQDISSMIMELMGEALATAEDTQGLVGTGSPFTGVLSDSTVNLTTMGSTKTAFTDVTLANLRDMVSQIKMAALPRCVWVMSPTVFGAVQKITENSQSIVTFQNPIVPNTITGGLLMPAGYIWGYPVYLSEVMPAVSASAVSTKFLIFGNFDYFFFGNRQGMNMEISGQATVGSVNAYASNHSIVRVIQRVGMAVGIGTAFAALKTAAS